MSGPPPLAPWSGCVAARYSEKSGRPPASGSSSSPPIRAASAAVARPISHARSVRRTGARTSTSGAVRSPMHEPYPLLVRENAARRLLDGQAELPAQLVRAGGEVAVQVAERTREEAGPERAQIVQAERGAELLQQVVHEPLGVGAHRDRAARAR